MSGLESNNYTYLLKMHDLNVAWIYLLLLLLLLISGYEKNELKIDVKYSNEKSDAKKYCMRACFKKEN